MDMAILPPMSNEHKDLRTVGRNEAGDAVELHDLDGNVFMVRINDHLKSLVNQPAPSMLRSVESEESGEISIKEMQARLRSGESMESISRTGNVSLEKIERYSQPILQERSYIISLAQKCELKNSKATLLETITEKLVPRGVEMKLCEWNAYRNEDGTWQVLLHYPTRDGKGSAEWRFESIKRTIISDDDGARWILDEEPAPREAVVRPIRSEEAPPRLISIRSTPTIEPVDLLDQDDQYDLEEEVDRDLTGNSSTFDDLQENDESDELALDMEIPSDAKRDGVTRRVSIPSWDDIMFGARKEDPNSPK